MSLTDADVAEIRRETIVAQLKLAKRFGVTPACIEAIVKGKPWRALAQEGGQPELTSPRLLSDDLDPQDQHHQNVQSELADFAHRLTPETPGISPGVSLLMHAPARDNLAEGRSPAMFEEARSLRLGFELGE